MRSNLDTATLSARAAAPLAAFLNEEKARRVMIYLPFRNELSPLALVSLLPETQFYLPRTTKSGLSVHPYDAPREHHRHGFEQPAAGTPALEPELLDAVVVPGLAFDREGYRLGYGGGYYDRFLARIPAGVLSVGLVPQALLAESLPREPWDVPVRYLATEKGVAPTLRSAAG